MQYARTAYDVIALVFFLLASTVIVNTTMMVIFERMREIGTVAAMGMTPREIVRLFFLEAFFIGAIGFFPAFFIYPSRLPINFAAKENYFGNWISQKLMTLLRAVPVEGRRDSKLLKAYLRYLEDNNILIFYQGGRSYDLGRIRSGPGWTIAQSTDSIEVVPVYIEGVSKIFGGPKAMGLFGRWLPRSLFRKMVIAFGSSIDFSFTSEYFFCSIAVLLFAYK